MEARESKENSYRSILKGTSLFGGVQVFQVLVNLVRGKFVAMFLGPEGMGISSLLSSSAYTITQFSQVGLNLAFTKEVAEHRDDRARLAMIRKVASRMVMVTALLGALFTIVFAPWLSRITFGSEEYAWQYVGLSVMVWLTVEGGGKAALLQGLHKVKIISMASVIAAIVGLAVGVPLYYYFGAKGIVPALIALQLSTYIFFSWGVRKVVPRSREKSRWSEMRPMARRLLGLGIVLMLTQLLTTASIYLLNTFIRMAGDMESVGLYSAANSLTNQYAGVVFTAMAMDYFPRLSAVGDDRENFNGVVNRQVVIVSLMAAPIVILIMGTAPVIIRLLLTDKFMEITPLMRWMGFGVLLKALAFPLGYITFAKNNRKTFLWLEGVACNVLYLGLGIPFYYCFGLIGLGYSMVLEYAGCIFLYYIVNRRLYGFRYNATAMRNMLAAVLLAAGCFAASYIPDLNYSIACMALTLVWSATFSFCKLKKLIKKKD